MATRAQKIRLGVFMVLATLLFVVAVGTLAGLKLWNPRDRYVVHFRESIGGLDVGASVKMQGVAVGKVESVTVEDVETVHVALALAPGTPVKTDTVAEISSFGITGIKFIELSGGSTRSPRLAPNTSKSLIKPGSSVVHTLTGKAIDISKKMELVLNKLLLVLDETNRSRLRSLIANADRLTGSLADVVVDGRAKRILRNADRATASLARASNSIDKLVEEATPNLRGALAATATAANSLSRAAEKLKPQRALAELTRAARALRDRIEDPAITAALTGLKSVTKTIRKASSDVGAAVSRNDRQLRRILALLNDTARNFKSFSRAIKERPSLLLRGDTVKERSVK